MNQSVAVRNVTALVLMAAAASPALVRADDSTVGAVIGGGIGAVIGNRVGGTGGAIVGGVIGAAAGAAVGANQQDQEVSYYPPTPPPPAVVYAPAYQPVYQPAYVPPPVVYGAPVYAYGSYGPTVVVRTGPRYYGPRYYSPRDYRPSYYGPHYYGTPAVVMDRGWHPHHGPGAWGRGYGGDGGNPGHWGGRPAGPPPGHFRPLPPG